MHKQAAALRHRLMDRAMPEPNSGCWLWTAYVDRDGYGHLKVNNRDTLAHRAAYTAFVGPIPEDMLVCHKCDVPSCLNPDHLFVGSYTDNARDMGRKGRSGAGRLRPVDILVIRASGLSAAELAAAFGVHASSINQIRRRHTWRTL